jgi:hypothetical protein
MDDAADVPEDEPPTLDAPPDCAELENTICEEPPLPLPEDEVPPALLATREDETDPPLEEPPALPGWHTWPTHNSPGAQSSSVLQGLSCCSSAGGVRGQPPSHSAPHTSPSRPSSVHLTSCGVACAARQ